MTVLLNNNEMEALSGLPHAAIAMYVMAIRTRMDYRTGKVGQRPKLSWQALKEWVYIERNQRGSQTQENLSVQQVRRIVQHLIRVGLLVSTADESVHWSKRRLEFFCPMAQVGYSASRKADKIADKEADKVADRKADNAKRTILWDIEVKADKEADKEADRKADRKADRHRLTSNSDTYVSDSVPPSVYPQPQIPTECPAEFSFPQAQTPAGEIFEIGVGLLTRAGIKERQARSFLGSLRKAHGDLAVVAKLRDCVREAPSEPLRWLAAALPTSLLKKGKFNQENFAEIDYGTGGQL